MIHQYFDGFITGSQIWQSNKSVHHENNWIEGCKHCPVVQAFLVLVAYPVLGHDQPIIISQNMPQAAEGSFSPTLKVRVSKKIYTKIKGIQLKLARGEEIYCPAQAKRARKFFPPGHVFCPLWASFSTFSTQLIQDIIYKFILTKSSGGGNFPLFPPSCTPMRMKIFARIRIRKKMRIRNAAYTRNNPRWLIVGIFLSQLLRVQGYGMVKIWNLGHHNNLFKTLGSIENLFWHSDYDVFQHY